MQIIFGKLGKFIQATYIFKKNELKMENNVVTFDTKATEFHVQIQF